MAPIRVRDRNRARDCRKLGMSGSSRPVLAIRCEKQARVSPRPKGVCGCRLMDTRKPGRPACRLARVVEQSDKNGWQKLDEPQPGQVHPRLIGPAAVGARMSSGEPTWRRSLLGCRRAPRPAARGADWSAEWAKTARNGAKMATLEGICYVGENGVTPLSLKC